MNVIFVDIDGPLLPGKMHMFKENDTRGKPLATPTFDQWAVRCFNVWTKYANAKAVLSTNWVHHWEVDRLMEAFAENGLELDWHEHPVTPKRFTSYRHTEILDWLEEYTDVEGDRFIAVDDDTTCQEIRPIIDSEHRDIHIIGDWVAVDYMNGISWKNFQDGCEHLGIDMEDVKEGEFGIKKLTEEEKEEQRKALEALSYCI